MISNKHEASISKFILLPIVVWVVIILAFLNVKNLPYSFSDNDYIVVRYLVKLVFTILLPLVLINLLYKNTSPFGIHFPPLKTSFQLSFRAYAVGGPAGITFLIIGLIGWSFTNWPGTITLSLVYLIVFYFVPKVTRSLPTRSEITSSNPLLDIVIICSVCTVLLVYFTYSYVPVLSKILYYIFIVGFGEELLFRGYIQSAFNQYFGKPFTIGNVAVGWGLFLSAFLFGLMHALVAVPTLWPWAIFTFVLGLTLGYIREKDGSVLAPALLHAMLDLPLVFFSAT